MRLVYPTQITQWKKQALEGLPQIFSSRREKAEQAEEELIATLYQQIGQLKVRGGLVGKKITKYPLRPNEPY